MGRGGEAVRAVWGFVTSPEAPDGIPAPQLTAASSGSNSPEVSDVEVELELGAVPCSCWGVNQIAFANAKQGSFMRQFPWIVAGLGPWESTEQTWVLLM